MNMIIMKRAKKVADCMHHLGGYTTHLHTSDSLPLARSEKGTTQKTYIARSRFTHTMI